MPSAELPGAAPPPRVPGWARQALVHSPDWARDFLYVAQRQLRGRRERVVPVTFAAGDRVPVVVLAGVLEPWTLMLPLAERLHAEGHPIHVVDALGMNTTSITAAAGVVLQVIAERDLHDVALVAHSKGGLIGKQVLRDDRSGRVAQLVALATPWHGSRLARLVPGRVIGSLRPSDPVIAALAQRTDLNGRITSIYPSLDQQIPEGSYLPGATNIEVAGPGHFRILRDPEALEAVVAAIGTPPGGSRRPASSPGRD